MSNYTYEDSLKKLSYEQIVNFPKISKSDHYAGEHVWKHKTSYVVMKSVFNLVDEIKILLRNRNLNKILENYFSNQKYKLTYVKAIKSYANNIPAIDTQFFHSDLDSFKLLKVLIYLDNVTNINQGPSQFVLNSNVFDFMNKKLINNWPIRASEKEIKKNFGNKIKTFLGKCGDALFLNTAMLHRGSKPIQEDRWILILSYCVHDEIFSKGKL
jgi:GTP-sensing pleiotropic transcriptional regulator CodY